MRYTFAKPASPVTATSKMQLAFRFLSATSRQSFCAVSRSSGFTGGLFGKTHGGFSGGQPANVNVAVDVPGV